MSDTDANLAVSQTELRADRYAVGATNYHLSAMEFGQHAGNLYPDLSWDEREAIMREQWEVKHNDSAWEDVKHWVLEGWNKVKGAVGN